MKKKKLKIQYNLLEQLRDNSINYNILLKDYISIIIKYLIINYIKFYTPESQVFFFYKGWLDLLLNLKMNKKNLLFQIEYFGSFCLKSIKYLDDFIETKFYFTYLSLLGLFFEIIQICYLFKLNVFKFLKTKLCDIHKDNLLMFIPFNLPIVNIFSCKLYENQINSINILKYLLFVYSQFIQFIIVKEC